MCGLCCVIWIMGCRGTFDLLLQRLHVLAQLVGLALQHHIDLESLVNKLLKRLQRCGCLPKLLLKVVVLLLKLLYARLLLQPSRMCMCMKATTTYHADLPVGGLQIVLKLGDLRKLLLGLVLQLLLGRVGSGSGWGQ